MKKSGIERILNILGAVCQGICSVLAIMMVVLVTVQVILRALNMPLFGIEELLTFPTIWLYFLGGACASFTDSHIDCGLIKAVGKNPVLVGAAQCVANTAESLLSIYVISWAWQYLQYSLKMHKTSAVLHIPMPIGESVIFTGLVLMMVFTVARTVQSYIELKKLKAEGGREQ